MSRIILPGGAGSSAISGVTVTGTAAAGQAPIASSSSAGAWAYPPGFQIGLDSITAGVNVLATSEATGTTIIAGTAHTFDGGAVKAEFFSPQLVLPAPSAAQSTMTICLFESSTQIGRLLVANYTNPATSINLTFAQKGELLFTPSAGSHTYTVTAFVSTTTGTPAVGAGAGGTGASVACFVRYIKV